MTEAPAASAVIARVPLPDDLERLRRGTSTAARTGLPAHITLLYPFLEPVRLVDTVRRRLVEIAAAVEPFDVRFRRTGRFPQVVYLEPEPMAPFRRLTEAIEAACPDHPPNGGAHPEVHPHLTIAEGDLATAEVEDVVRRGLPVRRSVRALDVIVQDDDGRWRVRWRVRLGTRAGVRR